jgi:hypothetical protein
LGDLPGLYFDSFHSSAKDISDDGSITVGQRRLEGQAGGRTARNAHTRLDALKTVRFAIDAEHPASRLGRRSSRSRARPAARCTERIGPKSN